MFKKLKENKKGFTLVELIVVLVILAILAALLVPALTGYIDRAKDKAIIAETRQTVMAAQTLIDEAYAKVDAKTKITVEGEATGTSIDVTKEAIAKLAELSVANIGAITTDDEGHLKSLVYTKGSKTCTYDSTKTGDEKYAVSKATK